MTTDIIELSKQAALSAKSVPDGYVLVPVKPTEDMLAAASRHYESDSYTGVTSTYQAMLAAAPQVTTDKELP